MFCSHCGSAIAEGQAFCHVCGANIATSAPVPKEPTAWERRTEVGFFRGLLLTLRGSLFSPAAFFRSMPTTGGLTDSTLYAMITGMTGWTVLVAWQAMTGDGVPSPSPGVPGGNVVGAALTALVMPFLLVANVYLWAGMLHVLLLAARGATQGFEATFRVAAHSYGAMVFLALPFCGWPVAVFWSMVLAIVGLKETHGASSGKAAYAVLFPALFCCAATALFTALFFGTLAASFGAMTYPWK